MKDKERLILLRIATNLKPLEDELIYLEERKDYCILNNLPFEKEKVLGQIHGYTVAVQNIKTIQKTVTELYKNYSCNECDFETDDYLKWRNHEC